MKKKYLQTQQKYQEMEKKGTSISHQRHIMRIRNPSKRLEQRIASGAQIICKIVCY